MQPMKARIRLMQMILLQVGFTVFLFLAASAGWVYTRGERDDLIRWLPIIAVGNTIGLGLLSASATKGPWPRRLLTTLPGVGVVCLIWYGTAYLARTLFYWDDTFAVVAGQVASLLALMVFALKQLADGIAGEERDESQKQIEERLGRLERTLKSSKPEPRPRRKGKHRR